MTEDENELPAWTSFSYYMPRWILFGVIGSFLQPVGTSDYGFWTIKLMQVGIGVISGVVCGLIFIPLQNFFNPSRSRLRFWSIAIFAYAFPKFVVAIVFR